MGSTPSRSSGNIHARTETSSEPQFSAYFPKLFGILQSDTIPSILSGCEIMQEAYPEIEEQIYQVCKDELDEVIGKDVMDELISYGHCYLHILMVVYNCYTDERFQDLLPSHQNQLLWAALLHDIGKRGKPVFEGKDHIHPFRSAGIAMEIFVKTEFIQEKYKDKALELSEITLEAYKEIDCPKFKRKHRKNWDKMCQHCHDHSQLEKIFEYLKYVSQGDSFIINTFALVLFHQSIYGIKCYRPVVEISDEDIKKYIDPSTLDMYEIIMNADSHAYTIIGVDQVLVKKYKKEISKEIKRIKIEVFEQKKNKKSDHSNVDSR
ncbi:unnamed protein product [Moneuplotes crassus]|uniref:HD domain-containing protein n=1 Tax=Euplotes crassus TaxID=5936 RepID=A0AAD1XGA4_EUPCR|nr:unnamed protein product [Moneuplotes crassus]